MASSTLVGGHGCATRKQYVFDGEQHPINVRLAAEKKLTHFEREPLILRRVGATLRKRLKALNGSHQTAEPEWSPDRHCFCEPVVYPSASVNASFESSTRNAIFLAHMPVELLKGHSAPGLHIVIAALYGGNVVINDVG
jgi:hypothetical protein